MLKIDPYMKQKCLLSLCFTEHFPGESTQLRKTRKDDEGIQIGKKEIQKKILTSIKTISETIIMNS